jgi:GNAT superfamily N-acetyltransferase
MSDRWVAIQARTGESLWVREIEPADAAELQHAFGQLTARSRYQRFLTGTPSLSNADARTLTTVDQRNHVALVAMPADLPDAMVGVARFIRDRQAPLEADLAITVADEWQGMGVGTGLLHLLIGRARRAGIRRFTVDVLEDNVVVRALVTSAGGVIAPAGSGVMTGYISL